MTHLKVMYENEKNPSGVFEIYERLFKLRQEDQSVPEYYRELKSLMDELAMHQSAVTNTTTPREYFQDLAVSKLLSEVSLIVITGARSVLGGNSIPTLIVTFSSVCLLEQMYSLHHLLSSLPWSSNVAEVAVIVVVVILEDVDPLEGDTAHIVANRVSLIKDHVKVDIVGE